MKLENSNLDKIKMNKKGVFGLTSVQAFFAIILGIAILAYVIVLIFGALQTASVIPDLTTTVVNETGYINATGYTLSGGTNATTANPHGLSIIQVRNSTNTIIAAANYTVSGFTITNATSVQVGFGNATNFTYSYQYFSASEVGANNLGNNVSYGVTSFFSSINPVYAILAILVIILILVVVVRVVTGGTGGVSVSRESQYNL